MKAFPTEHAIAGTMSYCADGMDLRDYFAAKAMGNLSWQANYDDRYLEDRAKRCYEMADAMMKARKQ